jgi:hypothetical protein
MVPVSYEVKDQRFRASQPLTFSVSQPLFPHSRRGVGIGPYGPEAAFQFPNSIASVILHLASPPATNNKSRYEYGSMTREALEK